VFNFARHQTWLEGVTATYATEGRMWKRYTPEQEHKEDGVLGEGEALERHYGFPKEALLFYNVHSDANDEHGDIDEAILKKYCRTAEQQ
jgi:pyrroloquinoline quinone (PQQ) biosynthesis protein C